MRRRGGEDGEYGGRQKGNGNGNGNGRGNGAPDFPASPFGAGNNEAPYRDAIPELGEKPLREIDTFIVRGRDEKGASSHIHLNVPPAMLRATQAILKSGRFPYLDTSDFIRHAMMRHIRFCFSIRETLPKHIVVQLDAIMEVCRDNEFRLQAVAAFEMLDRAIRSCMNRSEVGEAVRLFNLCRDRLANVPDSPRKNLVLRELFARYGYITGEDGEIRQGDAEEVTEELERISALNGNGGGGTDRAVQ